MMKDVEENAWEKEAKEKHTEYYLFHLRQTQLSILSSETKTFMP